MAGTGRAAPDVAPGAICARCAERKASALAPCYKCGYTPDNEAAITLSLILSQQFSTTEELTIAAADIRAGRKLTLTAPILARARAVAQALIAKKATAHLRTPRLGQVAPQTESNAPLPPPIPPLFASNSFSLLNATPRDKRARIIELAEEQAFIGDTELITKARAQLTHPRARLSAEVGWFPGVSPKRASECLLMVARTPERAFEIDALPPLPRANLLAAAFDNIAVDGPRRAWSKWLNDFATVVDSIDVETLRRHINEDRTVAGFAEVASADWIEVELSERRNLYTRVIHGWLDRFPTEELLGVLTETIVLATNGGTAHAPRLLEEVVADFELTAQGAFTNADTGVNKLLEHARVQASGGEAALDQILQQLERIVRQWVHVIQPAQICAKSRGEAHGLSEKLFYQIRSLGVDLANDHGLFSVSERITRLLQNAFVDVQTAAETTQEDIAAIKRLAEQQAVAAQAQAAFEREITYCAEIGLLFKRRIAISPQGLEWGATKFGLDTVSRVRWGATRHSINFIPFGTVYHVAFGDDANIAIVKLNSKSIYEKVVDKLWRAVCVRMMMSYATALKAGQSVPFGEIVIHDEWCEVPLRKLASSTRLKAPWSDTNVWSSNGAFVVGLKSNPKAHGSISYQNADNAHVLEQMIRLFFKDEKARRVSEAFLK